MRARSSPRTSRDRLTVPAAAAEQSLRALGVDQVDLYIVHWPGGGPTWAWPGMEEAHQRGYARSIGVSNFSVSELDQVIAIATVAPVLNQVQFSPFEYRRAACGLPRASGRPRGLQPARDGQPSLRSHRRRDRGSARTHAGTGPTALVHPARDNRDPEVDASRAARRKRRALRLRAVSGRTGRPRRARPNRRHRACARALLVVS